MSSALVRVDAPPAATNGARPVEIWGDASGVAEGDSALLEALLFEPLDYLIARPDQLADLHVPDRITAACVVIRPEDVARAASLASVAVVDDPETGRAAREAGLAVALRVAVDDGATLDEARAKAVGPDHLLVRFADPTNIPLELLLAESQQTGTRIVKEVVSVDDAVISLGVLEHGPGGVLFKVQGADAIAGVGRYLAESQKTELELVEAVVTSARPVGLGYRACVDTVSLFEEDEGFVVGSTSAGGLLVCAEVHYLPYMNLRPFRVNAGAVHSYAWGREVTEYLTDLEPGSELLAVDTSGVARPVTVGRVKIEVRSLRLIEAEAGTGKVNLFVQDDWHVRIFGADGRPRNCSTIVAGDALLAHVCKPGRHVGIAIEETIDER